MTEDELLSHQVMGWRAEVSRLSGLIAFATKDSGASYSLQEELIDVGTGKIAHIYNGSCPDELEGRDTRDPECSACQVLTRAALAAPQQEPVGHIYTMEALVPGCSVKYHAQIYKVLPPGTMLYTAPPPPADPVLSDEDCLQAFSDVVRTDGGEMFIDVDVEQAIRIARSLLAKVRP